jgi:general stress protein 26
MKSIRIFAMALATMGVIHIVATFTPLINGGLELLSPAKQQAMIYMSLMCGMLLIVCGLLIAMLHKKVKEHPFLRRPYMLIYGALSVDGIAAVAFMPHNPFAWLVFILICCLVILFFTMTKRNKYNDKMKKLLCPLFLLVAGVQFVQAQDQSDNKYKKETNIKMKKEMKFCQSCGMPLTDEVLGTNADGSKNEDYCMYCYKDGKFLQDCTMEEMIEHCAQFVGAVNEGLEKPITKEEYIGMMKTYFPQLKRWRKTLNVSSDEVMTVNPALAGVKELIAQMADKQPIAYISSVDQDGFPWTKAMLKPRKRESIKTFYFTTNTFSIRVAQYKANPKASIYFCDAEGFKGMMLRGTMEVLTDAASKEMIWRDGDTEYYPGGVTDPNYCVLKFTATDGRFYSDFYPRSFVIE